MTSTDPIVVGVDEYPTSLPAVDLAVREAQLRAVGVRLIHADPWAGHPAWRGHPDPESAPEKAIHAALERARTGLAYPISGDVVPGNPVPVLLQAASHASMLVVGHRGAGGFEELALGSVARELAAHAPVPVLVARGTADDEDPIVLAVDGSPNNQPAVAFAFEEAALREVPLVAIHTWVDPVSLGPGTMMPLVFDVALVEAEEHDVLRDAIAPWREKYPQVAVEERLIRSRAAAPLLEASATAQLIVVGSRGRGGFPGLRLGSVSHALLHHSQCPVAVVHHGPGETPDPQQR